MLLNEISTLINVYNIRSAVTIQEVKMRKVIVSIILLAGIGAAAHAIYPTNSHETNQPEGSKSLTQNQEGESKNRVLYAGGNVPCNPAKEVCEE